MKAMARLRLALAVLAAKGTARLIRLLRRGYGATLPGKVARRLAPDILSRLAGQVRLGTAMITGTNGKTTITKLLAAILTERGYRVFYNRGGANLVSGITAAFALNASPDGRIAADFALLETDEATMPKVAPELRPRLILANDYFRDQLDRFGELDSAVESLRKALPYLAPDGVLVLNADDPLCVGAGMAAPQRKLYYGVEADGVETAAAAADSFSQAADAVFCPLCHGRFAYARRSYSHLGDWACTRCDYRRPLPEVYAERIEFLGMRGSRVTAVTPAGRLDLQVPLPGLYSVYNVLGAIAAALALGAPLSAVAPAVEKAAGGFGRAEFFRLQGKEGCLLLVKNPTGFNQVLATLALDRDPKTLLFAINDRIADGRDISWLWDVDLEQLWGRDEIARTVHVTGDRAEDMALRLKYSGPESVLPTVVRPPEEALRRALSATPPGSTLYVLATYTAMLELWEVIRRKGDPRLARAERAPDA
ncbi:MAG: MurT ligase domain-containing protein [Bacillota bacterium]|nr:MurT ligase domain-containing protein [Bacillota bacterium]